MKEIFKAIPGYEGIYEVSNLGNVKSLDRLDAAGRKLKGKPKKQSTQLSGYKLVTLCKDGRYIIRSIHQLVAIAFLGHEPCGYSLVVNHENFNRADNRLENLEITTQRENTNRKHIPSSSQYVGVSWNKQLKKWQAYITINRKIKYLGCFTDELEAANKYKEALDALNQTNINPK